MAPLAGFLARCWSRGAVVDVGARTHCSPAGPPSNYLPPPTGIQSGQGQGDSEGRVHAGGEGSNLRV